ncbi:hypothetical protein [Leptospira stimsonii]|uniref:Uncharacterized protein n=1 Tax=Leptospira stimsonii TaxID=2202203 RepID=A0ABY2MZM8_9LEPT|nr:hypothetical protein [Leptospira stimsonii]TGK18838.1 hypothetical protein EHO98_12270 [Leptospira stimsonii]TGM12906.1 hypothetical protein EHQ90_14725 [Leptospira stimsonii]
MSEQESEKERGSALGSTDYLQINSKDELIEACIRIAKMKRPIAEIAKLVKPLGIPYYTVYHVFIGKSNRKEVLDIFTELGIPHNRKPIRVIPYKQKNDE